MRIKRVLYILGFLLIVSLVYGTFVSVRNNTALASPSVDHWCGTGLFGEDIFIDTVVATGIEVLTVLLVSPLVWAFGMMLGAMGSIPSSRIIQEIIMSLIHVVATFPVLLLALFLLILFGGGYGNIIVILFVAALPGQTLYAYNQFEQAKREEFYLAKQSCGLSRRYIYKNHLLPYIFRRYNHYTLSRFPEILMMSLALNFLGLGVKPPTPNLGRMLFDGLSFMFSAWWLWLFPVGSIIFVFLILDQVWPKLLKQ